jgi:hypothetical protein
MSSRSKQRGSRSRLDGKARRLLQLVEQRQLRHRQQKMNPYRQASGSLPDKQQQTQHNPVSEGLPFGLFTSDQ